ncbi:hypothetical protein PSUM_05160 [Pseudomonas umsongensis]|uniref:Uncharacterized protein n=1 Tax=Pseudomonas umsongensis TaxID=198618 RepID=A0ABX4E1U8_9PSED|nr:hypothetical protein PSUM_05160 [Pseudomonas umsongensis]SDT28658.1 hypothetical protein SAMN04490206_2583 [Pseudomonas umsongensis]
MLAMVTNDYAGNLTPRGVLGFIASMLAPTERPETTVGASLLAKAAPHSTSLLTDAPLSRAGSLPQGGG